MNETETEFALDRHTSQFSEVKTTERTPLIDLNAINRLSTLREDWQNASNTDSEHALSTAAATDDTAYLETNEHGQYAAGYQAQAGTGVRLPTTPTGDSECRWGYYNVDASGAPLNGFYFGVDSTSVFVARADNGSIEKVYQDEWNVDQLRDGTNVRNPSGETLDLAEGNIFQTDFTYYGYGPIQMDILVGETDAAIQRQYSDTQTVHVFDVDGATSIENTNLPLRQEIVSGGTNNDALSLYVGGRQFSMVGKDTTNGRRTGHYRDSLSGVDDTQWYPVISFKIKDGDEGIGSGDDYSHALAEIGGFETDTDTNAYRWQIRRGTTPDTPTWVNPTGAEDNPDETALAVDTSATSIADGSGNLTGVQLDGGVLAEGGNNSQQVRSVDAAGDIVDGQIVTLAVRATPGASGTITNTYFKALEKW